MTIGVGAKGAGCTRGVPAPSPYPWPAPPHERAPRACSWAAVGALRLRLEAAPQSARPVSPVNGTGRRRQRPPALHRWPAPATPTGGLSSSSRRPFDSVVGSRLTTTCNKSRAHVKHDPLGSYLDITVSHMSIQYDEQSVTISIHAKMQQTVSESNVCPVLA